MFSRVVVTAPPGKLGIQVVDDATNEVHTVISKVNDDSPLATMVFPGDQIMTVNGIDVHQMDAEGISHVFRQQAMNKKTITIARNIQSADASISQSPHKKHKKSSSVYPHSSPSITPPAAFSQSHEKSYGVPVDTYSGFDIEEGRQPIESGSSQCQEPRHRPKFFLLSILIIIALLITGAAVAAIVVLLGANDQVESNDSAVAKKEPSEDMVVHETISTNTVTNDDYSENIVPMEDTDESATSSTQQTTSTSSTQSISTPSTQTTSATTLLSSSSSSIGTPPMLTSAINDECETAIFFPFDNLPRMETGSTFNATSTFGPNSINVCGVTPQAGGAWYTFLGNGKSTFISFSNSLGDESQSFLLSGSCNTLICEKDFGSSDLMEVVLELGKEYWLLLTGKTSSAVGDYELSLSQKDETEGEPTQAASSFAAGFALFGQGSSTSPTSLSNAEASSTSNIITSTSTSSSTTTETTPTVSSISTTHQIASTTTTSTETTTSTSTISTPLIPTRDSGNEMCENAVAVTDFPISRTGYISNATKYSYSEQGPCNRGYDTYAYGVWYSVVSNKRRIVRVEYEKENHSERPWLRSTAMYTFEGSCDGLVCRDYERDKDVVVKEFLMLEGEINFFFIAVDYTGVDDFAGEYSFNITEYDVPVNDQCDRAIEIDSLPALYAGSTYGATPSFDEESSDDMCGIKWDSRGMWYRFSGNGREIHFDVNTTSSMVMSFFIGSCNFLLCDGKASSWDGRIHNELFAEEGQTYWLHLSGYDFDDVGDFNLSISDYDAPVNNECDGATEIALSATPSVVQGSNVGATLDLNLCNPEADSRGVWYSLKGEGKLVSISHTGQGAVSVLNGPCNNLACVGQFRLGFGVYEFVPENGIDYKMLVSRRDASDDASSHQLSFIQYEPPENDSCENAISMSSFPFSFNEDMKGARFMVKLDDYHDTSLRGVWFTFVGTGNSFRAELNMGSNVNSAIAFFAGTCNLLSVADEIIAGAPSSTLSTTMGTSYYIFIAPNEYEKEEYPFYFTVKEL